MKVLVKELAEFEGINKGARKSKTIGPNQDQAKLVISRRKVQLCIKIDLIKSMAEVANVRGFKQYFDKTKSVCKLKHNDTLIWFSCNEAMNQS